MYFDGPNIGKFMNHPNSSIHPGITSRTLSSFSSFVASFSNSLSAGGDLLRHVSTQTEGAARTIRGIEEDPTHDAVLQELERIKRESYNTGNTNEIVDNESSSAAQSNASQAATTTYDFTDSPVHVKSRWKNKWVEQSKEAKISKEQEEYKEAVFTAFFNAILEQDTEALRAFDFSEIKKVYQPFNQRSQNQSFREFVFANIRRQLLLHQPAIAPLGENPVGQLIDHLHPCGSALWLQKKVTEETAESLEQFLCLDALFSYGCLYDRETYATGTTEMSLECLVKYCDEVAQICSYLRALHAAGLRYIIPSFNASSENLVANHLRPIIAQTISTIIDAFAENLSKTAHSITTGKPIDPLNPYTWPTFSKEAGLERYATRYRKAIAKLLAGLEVVDFRSDSYIKQNYIFICALGKLDAKTFNTIIRSLSRVELISFLIKIDFDFVLLEDPSIHKNAQELLKDLTAGIEHNTLIFDDNNSESDGESRSLKEDKLQALCLVLAL